MESVIEEIKQKITTFWQTNVVENIKNSQKDKNAISDLMANVKPQLLSQLLPYQTYDSEHNLFINKKSVGFILETLPLTGANEETVTILSSILTHILPENADCQFLLWASDKVGDTLDRFEKCRAGKGDIYEWLAKKRTDYLKEGAYQSLIQNGVLVIRDFRLFISVSIPTREYVSVQETLSYLRNQIKSTLATTGLPSKEMNAVDFIRLLTDITSPTFETETTKASWQALDEIANQITDAECVLTVHPEHLSFERKQDEIIAQCFSVKHFPSAMAQWKMTESIGQLFNHILQIPCPFFISLNVRLLNQEKSAAKAQINYLDKDKDARSPLAKFNPRAGHQRNDWAFVRDRLTDGDRLASVFFQVILYSTKRDASTLESRLRNLYSANGWTLHKERYLQLQSWFALLPFMMSEGLYQDMAYFKRFRTMTAFNAINIAPLQGEYKGSKSPGLLLPGRRGQLATWLPFDNTEGNFNVCIAAASGKGKSVFTQEYIVSLLGSGGRVWVIDIGRSYEKTCKLLEGEFIEFSLDKPICINPFSFVRNLDESMEMLKPLLASMARPSGKASDEELSWIEKAIKAAFEEKEKLTTISDVANWLKTQENPVCQNLHLLLHSYTKEGMYGRYFEGEATIDFTHSFVVLELQELKSKKDLQRIVLFTLMYQIAEIMYLGNRTQYKSCIIDEAWDLLGGDNENAARFIEAGYRTARRYTGNFITITQSINDYFKNSTSIAAFECSDNLVLLGQKAESLDQVKKQDRLSMDPFSERLFKSLRKTEEYSECVIKTPSGLSVHRIIFDPYSLILYSSKGVEYDAVKSLQAKGYSLKEAISFVADERQKKQ